MPSGLQAHLQPLADRVPVAIGQRDQTPAQLGQHLLDQSPLAREADLEGVLEHHRQQLGRGGAAEDGPTVAGGEQIGQPADVVDASCSVVPAGKPGPSAKDGERAVDC